MRTGGIALALASLVGCSRAGNVTAHGTPVTEQRDAGDMGAVTPQAEAKPATASRTFLLASAARVTAGQEVVLLVQVGRGERELVAWNPEQNVVRHVASVAERDPAGGELSVEAAAAQAGLALAAGWIPRKGMAESDARYARVYPRGAPPVKLEGHRDSSQSVQPYAMVDVTGRLALLGTESEVAVVALDGGASRRLSGGQNRELDLALAYVEHGAGLAFHEGTLVWGPIAASAERVGVWGWPQYQQRFYLRSRTGAIAMFDESDRDALGKPATPRPAKRAAAELLMPDVERARIAPLPALTTTVLPYEAEPVRTFATRKVGVSDDGTRVAWFSRAVRGQWALRRVVLAGNAPPVEVAFTGERPHLFHDRQSSEGPFDGGDAPVALPGRDAFVVTVPPREGELTLVDFEARSATRLGAKGETAAVSIRGDAVVAGGALVHLGTKKSVMLRGCHEESVGGAATFMPDGSLWAALANNGAATIAQRFDASGRPQCDALMRGHGGARGHIAALAASAHTLFVLDDSAHLDAYDGSSGAHVASLEFGEHWIAARFDEGGAIELSGNASEAASSLWCKAANANVWSQCPASALSVPRRLHALLAP